MNVLWTKQKNNNIYSQDTATLHAHASGDGGNAPGRCCRLCGGETSLRHFADTYVWEGVEERYDQLLFDCFGVRVSPSDCMICEWCVRQLRNTERFRALVHAAFDKPPSEASIGTTHSVETEKTSYTKTNACENTTKPQKEIIELLKTRVSEPPRKRDVRKKHFLTNDNGGKRINIACEICKQRYPMIMPTEGLKKFVCSRCKKNGEIKSAVCRKCNIGMPSSMMKEHMELHAKANLRGKIRLRQTVKAAKRVNSASKDRSPCKYQCNFCPKKYSLAKNLVSHVRSTHCDACDNVCQECGEMFESLDKVGVHVCSHSCRAPLPHP